MVESVAAAETTMTTATSMKLKLRVARGSSQEVAMRRDPAHHGGHAQHDQQVGVRAPGPRLSG